LHASGIGHCLGLRGIRGVGGVGVTSQKDRVEVVVDIGAGGRLDCGGHRLCAACGHIGVEVDCGVGETCRSVGHEALLAFHVVVPGLDGAAILAGEGPE